MSHNPSVISRVYAADWSRQQKKRVCCVADLESRQVQFLDHPSLSLEVLLEIVGNDPCNGGKLLSFDLALGIPRSLADIQAGDNTFVDWLKRNGSKPSFWSETRNPKAWAPANPFISVPPGKGSLSAFHLVAGCDLRRSFDRYFQAKSPLIVSGIPGSVGSATRSFWQELLPLLKAEKSFSVWPFDGTLRQILRRKKIAVAECYPAIAYAVVLAKQLPTLRYRLSKTKRGTRIRALDLLPGLDWIQRHQIQLPNRARCTESEDDFDALFATLAQLRCVLEAPQLLESRNEFQAFEGDILCSNAIVKHEPATLFV